VPAQPFFKLTRAALATIVISAAAATAARADTIFSPTADPFPKGSGAVLAPTPTTQYGAVAQRDIYNFQLQSQTFDFLTGNEIDVVKAIDYFRFTNPAGVAGTASLPGTMTITIDGRTSSSQTGTFNEVLDVATFSGTDSFGDTLTLGMNPNQPSTGTLTIARTTANGGGYDISNSFIIYGSNSVNGGPVEYTPTTYSSALPIGFTPSPASVAEPASLALLGASVAAIGFVRRRRPQNGGGRPNSDRPISGFSA
jgi:hypothetical protein